MIEFHPHARPAGPLARPLTAKAVRKPHPLKSHENRLAVHKATLMPAPIATVVHATRAGANDRAFMAHASPAGIAHASRHAASPMRLAPVGVVPVAPIAPAALAGYYDDMDGLGFSLKPPKKLRKAVSNIGKTIVKAAKDVKKVTTLKNVLKVAAVVGAVLAAPVVLPALASGAGAVGGALFHGATGAAGLLARGVGSGARFIGGELKTVAGSLVPHGRGSAPAAAPDIFDPNGNPVDMGSGRVAAPAPVATPVSLSSPSPIQPAYAEAAASPGSAGSYGGGVSMPSVETAATAEPQTAGVSSGANLPLIALGAVALIMLARSPRRARR